MNVWIVKIKDTGFIEDDIKIFNSYSLANYYIKQHNKENEWFIEVASFRNEDDARFFIEKNYKYDYFCRG